MFLRDDRAVHADQKARASSVSGFSFDAGIESFHDDRAVHTDQRARASSLSVSSSVVFFCDDRAVHNDQKARASFASIFSSTAATNLSPAVAIVFFCDDRAIQNDQTSVSVFSVYNQKEQEGSSLDIRGREALHSRSARQEYEHNRGSHDGDPRPYRNPN